MLADRIPADAHGASLLPVLIGGGVALLLVAVAVTGYWGLFDPPKWVRVVGRLLYRPRRRHRWWRRNQLRPVRSVARVDLPDDAVQLIPVAEPLALESAPADVIEGPYPWFAGREFQHREEVSR